MKKQKKYGLEIWRIRSFPQNLAWIHAAVSEKPELTDGRTDAGRLRHDKKKKKIVKSHIFIPMVIRDFLFSLEICANLYLNERFFFFFFIFLKRDQQGAKMSKLYS